MFNSDQKNISPTTTKPKPVATIQAAIIVSMEKDANSSTMIAEKPNSRRKGC